MNWLYTGKSLFTTIGDDPKSDMLWSSLARESKLGFASVVAQVLWQALQRSSSAR